MQRILDLIEETLDADVTPQELADRAGYSLWHFLHLFTQEVGMPLQRYRMCRRLAHAIWHMHLGMGATDAALRWGFDTHSGFFRAFRREYGMPPAAWLRTHRVNEPAVPLLKEEVYKMLTREKFREALACWGGEAADLPLTPVTYPGSGHVSDTAMYAGDALILKACRDEPAARLAVELADALAARGIPAACALPLPDGRRTLPIAGVQMTLCRRIPGDALRAADLIRHPEGGRRVGEALAKLHLATADLDDLPADDEPYADHILGWALPRAKEALPAAFPADYADRVDRLRDLPTALIHRDPNPGNLIDTADGVGFVDFDLSRRFVRIFDPCYLITAVLSEVFERDDLPWQENWPALCQSVLDGYDSVTPLTQEERAAAATIMLGNEVMAIAAFADSSKFRHVFEINQRMLAWMLGHMPDVRK